jgi:Copper type II ascorbate-dependent monooxygenase, C-terminal domain
VDASGGARELLKKEKRAAANDLDRGPGYSSSMGVGFRPSGGLSGWAPGQVPHFLPEGTGYLLPKGADVVLQVHYHRDGRVEKDRSTIGLYFAREPVKKRFWGLAIPGRFFLIPRDNDHYPVKGSIWVQQDCEIHSVMPHMHLLGKEITMTPPEGERRTLVAIKDWDYNWQETYFFQEPIKVVSGTRFDIEAVYDNSANNPNNPFAPPRPVLFGNQTTNEMCFGFLGATSDQPGRIRVRAQPPKDEQGDKVTR